MKIWTVLALVSAAALGFLIFSNLEAYEESVFRGKSPEAITNEYFALQTHLADYNTKVSVLDDVSVLFTDANSKSTILENNDVVILGESTMDISSLLASKILEWTERGGHLVIGMASRFDSKMLIESQQATNSTLFKNELLTALSVNARIFDPELLTELPQRKASFNTPTRVYTEKFGTLSVNVDDTIYIEAKSSHIVTQSVALLPKTHPDKPSIVQLKIGNGFVTLMTDVYLWKNDHINDYDNIFFIHELIQQRPHIYIVVPQEASMWPSIIAQYSPSFYWILLFVVLLHIWYFAIRFGSIKVVDNTMTSYFFEHIRAAGQFYWTNGQQQKLLLALRTTLLEEMSSKIMHGRVNEEQYISALANMSALSTEQIHRVVFDNKKLNEAQFTHTIQCLQHLREMICKNSLSNS